ncbi:unnamed protein product [Nezara viridula]|uniref:Uncharacterized protein n=1 Tax=Nezara viridula TaxID=85310 RepID=A0A9P0HRV3_NEZVI|nr:unnamed protein product [Nezara viridula]
MSMCAIYPSLTLSGAESILITYKQLSWRPAQGTSRFPHFFRFLFDISTPNSSCRVLYFLLLILRTQEYSTQTSGVARPATTPPR